MRHLVTITLAVFMVAAMATVAYGAWENTVWLGIDINQNGREMGYRHQDDVATKIVSSQCTASSGRRFRSGVHLWILGTIRVCMPPLGPASMAVWIFFLGPV